MDARRELRATVLRSLGANDSQAEECLLYNDNVFQRGAGRGLRFPLPDEPFVSVWEEYARERRRTGSIAFLADCLIQLRFPVRAGISALPAYRDAVRKGREPEGVADASGLVLRAPERCDIRIHPTAAGRIPLLIAPVREDFVALVRALTKRNEPVEIPDSMGACMVGGYNNWHQIRQLRQIWQAAHPCAAGQGWEGEFQRIVPQKNLYQNRFILLSGGPYSGVPARDLGLGESEWLRLSLVVRREHECAHYFTRRVFGSMRNRMLDELIADYCGVVAALGAFRAAWFLRFVGLEDFPALRRGGRLWNYRGDPPLSPAAFHILKSVVKRAAENLEQFDRERGACQEGPPGPEVIAALAAFTLEELASDDAVRQLTVTFSSKKETVHA